MTTLSHDGHSDGPCVTVLVPVRNEIRRIDAVIRGLEAQTLRPHEVIVIDGASTDGTREWLERASSDRPWLRVVDNPARLIPHALNLGLREATCDFVARMDAHVDYVPAYLAVLHEFLIHRPEVMAAGAPYDATGEGLWGTAIAAVLRRPWGHGGASHRAATQPRESHHASCPMYRRSAVQAVGGWNEAMLVNEDEELDIRVGRHGSVWVLPQVTSTWHVRSDPRSLTRQMWRYGYYRAQTVRRHPRSLNVRILAPSALVLSIAGTTMTNPRRGLQLGGVYLAVAAALGAGSAAADGASLIRGAPILPLVHLPYGTGFIAGLTRRPKP